MAQTSKLLDLWRWHCAVLYGLLGVFRLDAAACRLSVAGNNASPRCVPEMKRSAELSESFRRHAFNLHLICSLPDTGLGLLNI